ncbi:MAG: ATP-dependent DNA helicase RecG [Bdellovibrionales bacterium CG10_big_fil_rev_8_21_14_0_10_45_34]|nr:MAG: ATP-dependent DNA helicase RecG [Bdellovibrionales bacterium CG10_big_fil_rev_8_21_14_0_10_45_34]
MAAGELWFDTSIQYVKGVGPGIAKLFEGRGIYCVQDLLHFYPRAFEDRRVARSITSLNSGELVSLKASVVKVSTSTLGRSRRKVVTIVIKDDSGLIACKYFRIPFKGFSDRFQPGTMVRVSGKPQVYRNTLEFHHPDLRPIETESQETEESGVVPIYVEIEGLSPQRLRKIIATTLEAVKNNVKDHLPVHIRHQHSLIGLHEALKDIHEPHAGQAELYARFRSPGQIRLIFDEFFRLEIFWATKKRNLLRLEAYELSPKLTLVEKFKSQLSFQPTTGQIRAFEEILKDLSKNSPMNRLLQGDVGSGKTLVAFMAALVAVENGFQVAIMAPTEILAEQLYQNALKTLPIESARIGLLVGGQTSNEKQQVQAQLKSGEFSVCIGTHALIQEGVEFQKLGLVIIDEQHRFGVTQRKVLKDKGEQPHNLIMSATPIPRTLAMTVYGDLDVSSIREKPHGRKPIQTRVAFESKRPQVEDFVRKQLEKSRQAYVVYPLVEESEKLDLKNAATQCELLREKFQPFQVGLLHGRMSAKEKREVMESFRAGALSLLVSTTVIEVGVDVPNANIIWIEHSERFGLSQLHQLRGRVGRGSHQSFCILSLGHAVSQEAIDRVRVLEQSDDGFKVAEADLELRGPGEFLGHRQSGLGGFQMAHIIRDQEILMKAKESAFALVESTADPTKSSQLQTLKKELSKLRGWELGDIS